MERSGPVLIHATAVALPVDEGWVGVLLRGASGSGKSDLAVRLIDEGARLIADDQTELWPRDGGLDLRAPARLAGQLEVRGLGLVEVPSVAHAPLGLVAQLVSSTEIERLPPPLSETVAGVRVAAVRLAALEASAPAKLRLAVRAATAGSLGSLDKLAGQ